MPLFNLELDTRQLESAGAFVIGHKETYLEHVGQVLLDITQHTIQQFPQREGLADDVTANLKEVRVLKGEPVQLTISWTKEDDHLAHDAVSLIATGALADLTNHLPLGIQASVWIMQVVGSTFVNGSREA
jgi:hypothetical protein